MEISMKLEHKINIAETGERNFSPCMIGIGQIFCANSATIWKEWRLDFGTLPVRCPICGKLNQVKNLREEKGWMECEHCGMIGHLYHPDELQTDFANSVITGPWNILDYYVTDGTPVKVPGRTIDFVRAQVMKDPKDAQLFDETVKEFCSKLDPDREETAGRLEEIYVNPLKSKVYRVTYSERQMLNKIRENNSHGWVTKIYTSPDKYYCLSTVKGRSRTGMRLSACDKGRHDVYLKRKAARKHLKLAMS